MAAARATRPARTRKKSDSTMGKLMEKAGSMTKNEKLMEKGAEKREAAGYGQGSSDNNY